MDFLCRTSSRKSLKSSYSLILYVDDVWCVRSVYATLSFFIGAQHLTDLTPWTRAVVSGLFVLGIGHVWLGIYYFRYKHNVCLAHVFATSIYLLHICGGAVLYVCVHYAFVLPNGSATLCEWIVISYFHLSATNGQEIYAWTFSILTMSVWWLCGVAVPRSLEIERFFHSFTMLRPSFTDGGMWWNNDAAFWFNVFAFAVRSFTSRHSPLTLFFFAWAFMVFFARARCRKPHHNSSLWICSQRNFYRPPVRPFDQIAFAHAPRICLCMIFYSEILHCKLYIEPLNRILILHASRNHIFHCVDDISLF